MSSGGRHGSATVGLLSAGGATLTYVAVLGWDRAYDRDPATGNLSGPYDVWQLAACAAALALLAAAGGRARRASVSTGALTVAFTVAWSVGAATLKTSGPNLWPIGAALLAPAVFAWTLPFSLIAQRRAEGD